MLPAQRRSASSILAAIGFSLLASSAGQRNNILFMLVDDGGFELSPFGNNITRTPNIGALAASGVTFDRAYTAVSSCSPSRSAILSGLPTHENGMYGLHQPPGNFASNTDITSLPNILNNHGYKTGIIGKYHVGPQANYNFTYGLRLDDCWAGAADCTNSLPGGYNMATRNVTFMKLNARKFLTEIEPDAPFFLCVMPARAAPAAVHSHRTTCKMPRPLHCLLPVVLPRDVRCMLWAAVVRGLLVVSCMLRRCIVSRMLHPAAGTWASATATAAAKGRRSVHSASTSAPTGTPQQNPRSNYNMQPPMRLQRATGNLSDSDAFCARAVSRAAALAALLYFALPCRAVPCRARAT
jgi:hypothetical protein